MGDFYVPLDKAVMAYRWDGTAETLQTIAFHARQRGYETRMTPDKQIRFSGQDQRDITIPYPVGKWFVFVADGFPARAMDEADFLAKYQQIGAGK